MTPDDLAEINRRAVALLGRIARGPVEVIRSALQPTAEDYEAVFLGSAAKQAADGYADFWANPPSALARPVHEEVRVVAMRSEELGDAPEFPGGYRKIAHLLAPGHVWCAFKFYGAGGTDVLAYNGLVARGDRWAWFPKPWRVLAVGLEAC